MEEQDTTDTSRSGGAGVGGSPARHGTGRKEETRRKITTLQHRSNLKVFTNYFFAIKFTNCSKGVRGIFEPKRTAFKTNMNN